MCLLLFFIYMGHKTTRLDFEKITIRITKTRGPFFFDFYVNAGQTCGVCAISCTTAWISCTVNSLTSDSLLQTAREKHPTSFPPADLISCKAISLWRRTLLFFAIRGHPISFAIFITSLRMVHGQQKISPPRHLTSLSSG